MNGTKEASGTFQSDWDYFPEHLFVFLNSDTAENVKHDGPLNMTSSGDVALAA